MNRIGAVLLSTIIVALSFSSMMPLQVQAAAALSDIQASCITESGAVISWTTNVNATGNMEYGISPGIYTDSAPTPADITADNTSHAMILSGLSANTTYYYRVKSDDGTGDTTSAEHSFKTKAFTISGVTATSITTNSATITWNTNVAATSNVEYGLDTSYGSTAPMSADTTADSTIHIVVLSGLSPNTTYHYRVKSKDASSNEVVSADHAFTTQPDVPPVISNVNWSGIATSTVIISWDTDELATSQVEYGPTTSYGLSSPLDSTLVTSHNIVLSGLSPDTAYHYKVKSTDASENEAISTGYTFTTLSDSTPPVISGVTATGITTTTAIINWNTNEMATSQVEYGLTNSYGSTTPLDSTLVFAHSVSLSGLESDTTYHYRVKSIDASGNEKISGDYTFATTDVTPPTTPANIARTTPGNDNTPTFTWDAAIDTASGVASYQVRIGSDSFTDISNVTTFTVADVLSDGSHTFEVRAVDNASNIGDAGSLAFNIDATPPTTPTNVTRTTPANDNTPTFTWDAATDATSGLERYQVRIDSDDFSYIGSATTFATADADALSDGSHTFEVRAVDRAGNAGEAGGLTFTIDATPPTTPTNITKTTPDSDDTPTFTWDAATDVTSGVASYQVRIDSGDFTDIGDVTTFTVGTALSGGSHTFEVRAVDGTGNTSIAGSLSFEVTRPSNWPIIVGAVAGALVVITATAYYIGRRHATRPSRG